MPAFNRIHGTRIVATPEALDAASWPDGALALRIAADEIFVNAPVSADQIDDPHAIVVSEGGFAGVWLPAAAALAFLERSCEWALPFDRPAFVQGAVAGIPAKLWLEKEQILLLVPAPYAAEMENRMQGQGLRET